MIRILRQIGFLAQQGGSGRFFGARVVQFRLIVQVEHLLTDKFKLVVLVLPFVFQNGITNPVEHRREAVIIILRPALEGMVVALGTA